MIDGFSEEAIRAVIEEKLAYEPIKTPVHRNTASQQKAYRVLEMWAKLPYSKLKEAMKLERITWQPSDLEWGHLLLGASEITETGNECLVEGRKYRNSEAGVEIAVDFDGYLDVVMTVCGNHILRAIENPLDGEIPYDLCYFIKNPESIWGIGLHESLEDNQLLLNFCLGTYIQSKALSSMPQIAVKRSALSESDDGRLKLGKVWSFRNEGDMDGFWKAFHDFEVYFISDFESTQSICFLNVS